MIDEEFYLGKQTPQTTDVPVVKREDGAAPPDPPGPAPAGEGAAPEVPPAGEGAAPEVPPEGEARVKLDKKTKLIYMVVFAGILCAAMIGGIWIAQNRSSPTTPSQTVPSPSVGEVTVSASPSVPVYLPSEVMTEPGSTAAAAEAPATVVSTNAPTAPSQSPSQTPAQSTAPLNTEAPITHFEVNTEDFNGPEKLLYAAGFLYNADQNMFYSQNDPWQRNMGYTSFYDEISVLGNMYFDTIRFEFKYGDKRWLYQIWKGRYGITSGCEMGIYYQERRTDNRQFYDIPTDGDPLPGMYFELYRYEDLMFKNGPARHWWLTGFRLLDPSESEALHMICTYNMPNKGICDAFEEAVREQCAANSKLTYTREGNDITLDWAY